MKYRPHILVTLLLVGSVSGCRLPPESRGLLPSLARRETPPAAETERDGTILAGLRMRSDEGSVRGVPADRVALRQRDMRSERDEPKRASRNDSGLVLADAAKIKSRLEKIRARSATSVTKPKPATRQPAKQDSSRPVILVSNSERERLRQSAAKPEETVVWQIEPEIRQSERHLSRPKASFEQPAKAVAEVRTSTRDRDQAWFEDFKAEASESNWLGPPSRRRRATTSDDGWEPNPPRSSR